MTLADRIVIMKHGYVQQVGTPWELYFKPANLFVAGFIGEPPMNFIRSTVKDGCIEVGGKKLDISSKLGQLKAQYEGKDVFFGFRPEAAVLGVQEKAYVMDAVVELTEMLGDNTNVYVNIEKDNAILKVNPHDTPEMDSKITFSTRDNRMEHKILGTTVIYGEEAAPQEENDGFVVKGDGALTAGGGAVSYKNEGDAGLPCDRTFIEAVITGDPSKIRSSYRDAFKSVSFTLACNKSMETGLPVKVELE